MSTESVFGLDTGVRSGAGAGVNVPQDACVDVGLGKGVVVNKGVGVTTLVTVDFTLMDAGEVVAVSAMTGVKVKIGVRDGVGVGVSVFVGVRDGVIERGGSGVFVRVGPGVLVGEGVFVGRGVNI